MLSVETKAKISAMRPDLPLGSIMDLLIQVWCGPDTRYFPSAFAEAIHISHDQVLTAFLLLQGEPLYILESQWVFLDGDRELPLAVEILAQAIKENEFRHPETGETVPEFMQSICIIYSAGSALNHLVLDPVDA